LVFFWNPIFASKRISKITKRNYILWTKKSMTRCHKWLHDYSHRILLQYYVDKVVVIYYWCIQLIDDDMVIGRMTSFFHCKFSSKWHPWLMTKWHGCPKYHLKTWLK
jgi:hypothetical protein